MMYRSLVSNSLLLIGCASVFAQQADIVRQEYTKAYGTGCGIKIKDGPHPNILLITSDQQVWNTVCSEHRIVKTPNIDRLVERGTLYTRAYTCNPVSTPTRVSMITGMYPSQHGAYALGTKLDEDVPTVGEYLNRIGYRSYLVGKAHFMPLAGTSEYPSLEGYPILQDLDFWRRYHGPFYGFDYIDLARNHGDEGHVGQHYALWMMDRLAEDGLSPDAWKKWFSVPNKQYAVYNPEMDDLTSCFQPENPERQHGMWNCPEEYHMNAWIAETSIKRIEEAQRSGSPFFLWSSFFDPHPPYLVPAPWDKMYDPDEMILPDVPENDMDDMPYHYRMTQTEDNSWGDAYREDGFPVHGLYSHKRVPDKQARQNMALYYGMISMMDKYIGEILDYLEDKDMLDNTMIIFTTDHGNHIGSHGLHFKGGFMFEEDVRIPFVVSWKNHFPENKVSDALVSIVDLAPTILSVAGMENLPLTMSGKDASGLFEGDIEEYRDHVLVENHFQRTRFYQKGMITDRYKIVWYMGSDEGELFDLKHDPGEHDNLWNDPEYQDLKYRLLHKALQADMEKEICPMPRVAPA